MSPFLPLYHWNPFIWGPIFLHVDYSICLLTVFLVPLTLPQIKESFLKHINYKAIEHMYTLYSFN